MFLIPTVVSIVVVYLLSERFLVKKHRSGKEDPQ